MLSFQYAKPEQHGIQSAHITRFVQRLQEKEIPMHSFILMREDAILAEGYYAPYTSQTPHRMFSIVKSYVSIAIGLCQEEGLLALDDTILSYFPEFENKCKHPWIRELTIKNMLMMRTCHASTTYKFDNQLDWIESFFVVTPTHKSGTVFHYDTSCAHVLCALVERLTGRHLLDYLRDRLAPLGLSQESYLLSDPFGHSHGGSGLVALPEDLLRFGYLLLHQGEVEGQQLVSREYIQAATSNLTSTKVTSPIPSEAAGYGYMIWQAERDGFVCYGMGGQLIIVLPKQKLICVTTADTQGISGGNQFIYDALYEEIVDKISDVPLEENQNDNDSLKDLLSSLSLPVVKGNPDSGQTNAFCNKTYHFEENTKGFISFVIEKQNLQYQLRLISKDECYLIPFGCEELALGNICGYKCASSAGWLDEHTLYLRCNIIDSCIGSIHFQFYFENDGACIFIKKIEESLFHEFTGHFYCKQS